MAKRSRSGSEGTPNYSGWYVDQDELLRQLSSQGIHVSHEVTVAHHVTYQYPDSSPAPPLDQMEVIGHALNDRIECVVVRVTLAGSSVATTERPNGATYHCTLSHVADARPVESNDLLRSGWRPITPFTLAATSF